MATYIIRRILWGIVTLVAVIFVTFLLFSVFPGANPAELLAGKGRNPTADRLHPPGTRAESRSWTRQFWHYMKGIVLHFNFGYSFYTDASGLEPDQATALPATLSLTVGAAVLWFVARDPGRDPLGDQAQDDLVDRAAMTAALGVRLDAGVLVRR